MIQLSLKEKMKFVKSYIHNDIDLSILNEKSNKKFENSILKEFESLLELSDKNNLIAWHKSLDLPNVSLENMQERIIETSSGKALLGIRFLGMNITKPFVNVWSNYDLEENLEEIIELAKKEFSVFKPKYLRFFVQPNSSLAKIYEHHKEQSFYVESIDKIRQLTKPLNFNEIKLVKINDLDFYDWYKNIYDDFHNENKKLKFLVPPSEKEDFERSIKDELIYHVQFSNKNVGLIAAESDDFLGTKSIYITEIVLLKEYKGKHLATAIQRKFIAEKTDFKYVWGKISQKNVPSTKNALRVGRKNISSEILLPI